jgi:signal transduction histidine kinase/putative methionine-R-sulfoxide reductase with GAF domain
MAETETGSQMNEQGARQDPAARETERLSRVAALARALNAAPNPGAAISSALRELAELIPTETLCFTASAGDDRQALRARIECRRDVEEVADGEVLRVRHTMLGRALEARATVYFNDVSTELISGALVMPLVCAAAASVLCAPLATGAGVNGLLIASTTRATAYTATDADTASAVAELLSATLRRLELTERVTGADEREQARLRETALVDRLYSTTGASFDLDRIIQQVIDVVARALPASFVTLRMATDGRPEAVLRAWTPGDDRPPLELNVPLSKAELAVYAEQSPMFIEDARSGRAAEQELRPLVERLGAFSIYLSPIIYGGRVLATIGLIESDAPRRWTPAEQQLLSRVAETVAPLILNAQLHARLRSYIEDLLTLLRLASDVTSHVDLDRLLRAVLDSWSKISETGAAAILRWDEEAKLLRLAAAKYLPTGLLERYTQGVPPSDPVCGLAATQRVAVVADLAGEARFAGLYAAVRWSGLRGVWATPIIGTARQLLGVVVTFSRVPAEASADEQRLADLFTRPIAIAFQSLNSSQQRHSQARHITELEDNLRQSERHKTEFMSIISHELRTPLNAIIGYAQMLIEGFSGELNEQQRADVQTIAESAEQLLRMVEETLDLARIDAQRFPIYMDSVAFDEVIRRAVADVRSTAEMKGLTIKIEVEEDAPVVRTDPERVRQILINLLSNAVKFTETGFIQVSVERVEAGSVQVSVADTGIGFDVASFPHIFDEFRQADASTTRTHGGSGLGLAISKRLVGRLGGNIGVTSTPGEGSIFWFRLPPEIPGADA